MRKTLAALKKGYNLLYSKLHGTPYYSVASGEHDNMSETELFAFIEKQ